MSVKKAIAGLIVMIGTGAFLSATMAVAYEEAPVPDGGTVSGKITFKGAAPAPKLFDFAKFPNPEVCSTVDSDGKGNRMLREVSVKDGNLTGVVVFIEEIGKGKPFKFPGAEVKAETCRFLLQGPSPFVGVVSKTAGLRFENTDDVKHNPHGYGVKGAKSDTIFNKQLLGKEKLVFEEKDIKKLRTAKVMKVECDQHNYMQFWAHAVENPYYAVVGDDGAFTIDGIPPGTYELTAWHPLLGEKEKKITVGPKGKVSATFEFAAK